MTKTATATATATATPTRICLFCALDVTLHTDAIGQPISCQQAADAIRYAEIENADLRTVMLRMVGR